MVKTGLGDWCAPITPIARAGPRVIKQSQAMVFITEREEGIGVLKFHVLVTRSDFCSPQVESQRLPVEARLRRHVVSPYPHVCQSRYSNLLNLLLAHDCLLTIPIIICSHVLTCIIHTSTSTINEST